MNYNAVKISKWTIPGYLLVLAIALLTPMHSDDFGTRIGGFPNFEGHFHRYMTWSGRLTADYLASYILWIDSHFIRSAINAFGTFGLTFAIASLPYSISSKKLDYKFIALFYIIMSVIWTCSPNLGQTSFWIVGATNYVWTNFFLVLLLNLIAPHLLTKKKHSAKFYFLVFMLAIISGCGNENMSLVAVGLFALLIMHALFINKNQIQLALTSFVGTSIGAAILLLAPGNFRRMSMEGDWWQNASWGYKLWLWAFKKMPFVIGVDLPLILIIAVMLALVMLSGKIKLSFSENKYVYILIPFFIFLTFIANFVMIGSPAYPPRATNGQFALLLCSLSLSSYLAIHYANKIVTAVIFAIGYITSAYSYTLMYRAYFFVSKQEEIRQSIMSRENAASKERAIIPEYKFRLLFNEGDKFDMFKPKQLPYFFGLKDVDYINTNFDYSVINTEGNDLSLDINGYAKGVKSWVYNNQLINDDYVIVIMLDHYNKDVWSQHDRFIGKSKSVVLDGKRYTLRSEPTLYAINGKAYFALNIGNNKSSGTIKTIEK
ncbi:DUF6056 family protein [Enterobacter kobei]|uniref:DUF6056 family protein n=2 Tax=Enterobacter kobei TaxID=208224 RepID=UPI001E5CF725|nr:DUF6056 family protein [Enterobacter kobei]MCE1980906.1 DUF6056 family protein [Enterobacter kobei]HDS6040823.1 hypothetical protein [Enterobacter kobei]